MRTVRRTPPFKHAHRRIFVSTDKIPWRVFKRAVSRAERHARKSTEQGVKLNQVVLSSMADWICESMEKGHLFEHVLPGVFRLAFVSDKSVRAWPHVYVEALEFMFKRYKRG